MLKPKFLLLALLSGIMLSSVAPYTNKVETGLFGKLTDEENGEPIIYGSIILFKDGNQFKGTQTDFDGNYSFLDLEPGIYDVEASYTGYASTKITGVKIPAGKATTLHITLRAGVTLNEVTVIDYKVPVIEQDNTTQGATISSDVVSAIGLSSPGIQPASPKGNRSKRKAAHHIEPVPYNTEDYAHIQENRFHKATDQPLSTFSIDVDASSYSNMRRFINNGSQPPKDAVRIEEMVNYFNYDYPQPEGKHPFSVITELSDCPWQPEHQLLHIGLQGKDIPTADLPPSNLVFLLDVSGSMNAPNKLPLLKSSFKLLVNQLREEDHVAIAVYAGAAGLVLPPTSGADKQKIMKALDNLYAGGSTAGAAGIKLAYQTARQHFLKEGNNRVILATDGDFNVGMSSDSELVRLIEKERESGIFLSVLGFGMGNYKDNKMQQLADKGNGNHAYIDQLSEARKVLVNEFGGTLFTIAKDVKLQLEFNPALVQAYRLIGYENRLLNNEDFKDDTKDAGELGSGHTVTALYELIPVGVESDFLTDVDPLKYQQKSTNKRKDTKGEVMTVKLRYKQPDGRKSTELSHVLQSKSFQKNPSENFRWSAAVAGFGMLLRDSDYKGQADYGKMITLAESAVGKDPNGYRAECIYLMKNSRTAFGLLEANRE